MQGGEIMLKEADDVMDLPPGFRFHPTDEEIISHYLAKKAMDTSFTALAIAEVDMNKCEPWDLPKKFTGGEKENYFFCQRDRKYPTGMRTNRATESGYWKATGKDKEIYKTKNCLVGMKKTLVFYKGRAPKGEKTNWVMHEYRLEGRYRYYNFPKGAKHEWVVCRVFHKNVGMGRSPIGELSRVDSFLNHFLDDDPCLPPLVDIPSCSTHGPGSQGFKGSSQHASYSPAKQENVFFMPTSYDIDNYNYASSSNPIPNQSYPFSGFKATPPSISAAIPGVHDSESQYCKAEPFFSNANSMVSPSRDTGFSNDISSIENNKSQDDLDSVSVDPSMSDLDSLWGYY